MTLQTEWFCVSTCFVYFQGRRFIADLLPDGKIQMPGTKETFTSPSAWAIHCKKQVNPHKKSGCGWASVSSGNFFTFNFKKRHLTFDIELNFFSDAFASVVIDIWQVTERHWFKSFCGHLILKVLYILKIGQGTLSTFLQCTKLKVGAGLY